MIELFLLTLGDDVPPVYTSIVPSTPRFDGAGVIYGNYYYTGGGKSGSGISDYNTQFIRINLDSLSAWEVMATPPALVNFPSMFVYNDYIYALCGYPGSGSNTRQLHRYNPANNTWALVTTLPTWAGASTSMIGPEPGDATPLGFIFASGNNSDMYSINMDTLALTKLTMPIATAYVRAIRVGKDIHVLTGFDYTSSSISRFHLIYDTVAKSWRNLTDSTRDNVREGGIATDGTYLYLYGGRTDTASVSTIWQCNPATNIWTSVVDTNRSVWRNVMIYYQGKLLSFGGQSWPTGGIYADGISYQLNP